MEKLRALFNNLFNSPIGELTIYEIIIAILLAVLAAFLVKKIIKLLVIGFKKFFRGIGRSLSLKKRCSKIVCRKCGRSLDNCICLENRGLSLRSRLYNYHRSERLRRKDIKRVEKNK